MKNTVITICREYGAEGHEIGKQLSERLGIPLYDKDLLAMAARESCLHRDDAAAVDEQIPGRTFYSLGDRKKEVMQAQLFQKETEIIKRLAETESCIIIGRLADYILRERPGCLKVFIRADMRIRTEVICRKRGCSLEEAKKMIRKMDQARNNFYQYYTGGKWSHATGKDLILDRGSFGVEGCVRLLECAVKEMDGI